MPRRPPKKWFNRCVRRVSKERPEVDDPQALCGWLWHHGMKRITKKRILKAEEALDPTRKKRKRGRPRKKTYDPAQVVRIRKSMITKPKVLGFGDYDCEGMIRVLEREDGSLFPEFAFYFNGKADSMVIESLEFAGLKETERNKFVLRTDKFNIFVYV